VNRTADAFTLSPVAIDVLTETLSLDSFWYPIEITFHGETDLERRAIGEGVWRELAASGLMRRGRVDADLEAALKLLARPDSLVTVLAALGDDRFVRARAVANGHLGVLAYQDTNDGPVRITSHDPVRVFADAVDLIGTNREHPAGPVTIELAADCGGSAGLLENAVRLGSGRQNWSADQVWKEKRLHAGVFTASITDSRGRPHIAPELEWFDTPLGRRIVRRAVDRSGRRSLVCEPAANPVIYRHLRNDLARLEDDL
jgi:hypothetical protein